MYWLAVVQRQTRRAFHHFKRQTKALPGGDEDALFRRFAALAEKFYASPLRETSFAKVYLEMMAAGFEHGFVFPTELMLHAKALTTAEALVFALAPDARFEQLSRPFIAREYVARTASLALLKRRTSQLVPELVLLGEPTTPGLGRAPGGAAGLAARGGETATAAPAACRERQAAAVPRHPRSIRLPKSNHDGGV